MKLDYKSSAGCLNAPIITLLALIGRAMQGEVVAVGARGQQTASRESEVGLPSLMPLPLGNNFSDCSYGSQKGRILNIYRDKQPHISLLRICSMTPWKQRKAIAKGASKQLNKPVQCGGNRNFTEKNVVLRPCG